MINIDKTINITSNNSKLNPSYIVPTYYPQYEQNLYDNINISWIENNLSDIDKDNLILYLINSIGIKHLVDILPSESIECLDTVLKNKY